jgi:hypothetical protein
MEAQDHAGVEEATTRCRPERRRLVVEVAGGSQGGAVEELDWRWQTGECHR